MNSQSKTVNKHKLSLLLAFSLVISVPKAHGAVQSLNSCSAIFGTDSVDVPLDPGTKFARELAPDNQNKLNIQTKPHSGLKGAPTSNIGKKSITNLPSENPFYDKLTGLIKKAAQHIYDVINGRSAKEQMEIDERSTDIFGRLLNMGFKTKDGKLFTPRVNGVPAIIEREQFDRLVKGMEPTLLKMRQILQVVMSKQTPEPADLRPILPDLSDKDLAYIIRETRGAYYEAQAVHESLKDYDFISVVGVDATMGGLMKHICQIFEINAGTPSGLSNFVMMLEVLRKTDPPMYKAITDYLAKAGVFDLMRKTMEAHGRKMIKEGGLTVELGAGIYNGAHPDMAMISYFSKMPLVYRKDLFIDEDGYVRLKKKILMEDGMYRLPGLEPIPHVGKDKYKGHVQISAIYSRAEEGNALQENTAGGRKGIGYKIPKYTEINEKLTKLNSYNPPLLPGVVYDYVKDADGNEIKVKVDERGQYVVNPYFDQFALDPTRLAKDQAPSLLNSIHARKVYLSNFGTRLIDHKGILSLVTEQVKVEFKRANPDKNVEEHIVSPPDELRTAKEREEFFKNPRQFVVKVPDESGGVGVYILPTETPEAVWLIKQWVKKNPEKFVIQRLADFMSVVKVENVDGEIRFVESAFDARTFMFMGPEGKVEADPSGVLVRVAKYRSLSTNTSQGAQYGILAVVEKVKQTFYDLKKPAIPRMEIPVVVDDLQMAIYLESIDMLINNNAPSEAEKRANFLNNFWQSSMYLMNVLGPQYSYMPPLLDRAMKGEVDSAELRSQALKTRTDLLKDFDKHFSEPIRESMLKHYRDPNWKINHSISQGTLLERAKNKLRGWLPDKDGKVPQMEQPPGAARLQQKLPAKAAPTTSSELVPVEEQIPGAHTRRLREERAKAQQEAEEASKGKPATPLAPIEPAEMQQQKWPQQMMQQ